MKVGEFNRRFDRTRMPEKGDRVRCPPDRGEGHYFGAVIRVNPGINVNIHGQNYVWVTVKRDLRGTGHVWPSNRLGYDLGKEGQTNDRRR